MSSVVDKVIDNFPAGLRVLAIDDDPTCLMCVERMLQACRYQVTKCQTAVEALSLLRERKDKFDIVLSDVHMPDMDGLRLLEIIRAEMDLPVVMMSIDHTNEVVKRVIVQGASDYLVKPVRLENVRVIWQHVVRKQRNNLKPLASSNVMDYSEVHQNKPRSDQGNAISGDKENCGSSNRYKDEEEEGFKDDIVSLKKPRMVWTTELHEQFVKVVNQIGLKNAVPKKILELMNVPGLTRENVASHLQKYRLYLRRNNENLQKKFSTTPLQLQDLNAQYNNTYAISNQLQQPYSISQIAHGTPNDVVGAINALVDLGSCYNYAMTDLMLGAEQQSCCIGGQVKVVHEVPTKIESEQDCSMAMQVMKNSYHPFALPSNIIDGSVTEMFEYELSPLDQHDLNSQFRHDDQASRLYAEHYGGQI